MQPHAAVYSAQNSFIHFHSSEAGIPELAIEKNSRTSHRASELQFIKKIFWHRF